eukprot:TRINITY_DN3187_c0_g1_i1.p1 TRINITY_DN3187_c0_g1~~TRINITY_DN3187_c0_g1_i1.p1  ORF type:complete len:293 (+),score=44.72 TRINITY_DN3187_c0_g1_i1:55-933(+)
MQWECPACAFKNKLSNQVCGGTGPMGCKTPMPSVGKSVSKGVAKGGALLSKGGAEWSCTSCGFNNKSTNQVCGGTGPMGCKMPKPAAPSYGPQRTQRLSAASMPYEMPSLGGKGKGGKGKSVQSGTGEWQCPCGFTNKAVNEVCGGNGPMGCKSPKEWYCGKCGFMNKAMNEVCGGSGSLGCKAPNLALSGETNVKSKGSSKGSSKGDLSAALLTMLTGGSKGVVKSFGAEWNCAACGFKNKATNEVCGGTGPMGCKSPKPSEWLCACGFKNRPSNDVCGGQGPMGCKSPRP